MKGGKIMIEEKYYTAMNDLVFKNALCTEKNKDILKWLIEQIIGYKLDNLIILNNERPVSNYKKKGRTLDVLAETKEEVFNIELNSTNYSALANRNAGYLMSSYVEDLNRGDSYNKMRKYIQINFTKKLSKDRDIEEIYTLYSPKSKREYIENFTIIEYNIDKLISYYHSSSQEEITKAKQYKHVLMLGLGGKELKKLCEGERHMEKFKDNVNKLNKDEKMRFLFSAEEDAIRTHNTLMEESKEAGIEQGHIEGEKAKAIEIAKNMLKEGLDVSIITKTTGLTKERIQSLNN